MRYFSLTDQENSLQNELSGIKTGLNQSNGLTIQAQLNEVRKEKQSIQATVEVVLTQQIDETLDRLGIDVSIDPVKFDVPPVNFRLATPPHLLVTSPLDRIVLQNQILLVQDISTQQMEAIESKADNLGVSSLVVDLGGFGATYPTSVADNAGFQWTVETAIHEWLHQYLAFEPLGFRYLLDALGIVKNYDIVVMNETVADTAAKEISSDLLATYYQQASQSNQTQPTTPGFDFNQEMRNARRTVDQLLAEGKITEAGTFMEQEREFLQTKGYYIRKLNQAYFAFNGIYADSPTSIDPLGDQIRTLRSQSASLKDFLNRVSVMTNRADVVKSIK